MSAVPVTTLLLEIHSWTPALEGRLIDGAGNGRCFGGWLGLAAALDRARAAAEPPSVDDPPDERISK